jgi:squamous cell carcinoma antigen recognized by T-cells 3
MNNTKFMSRILTVAISTPNHSKRQGTTIINPSVRSSATPVPESNYNGVASPSSMSLSPHSKENKPSREEIASRTIALLNIPDTVNDARIRAIVEPYGALGKIVLRPDHQGCIVEFQNVADAGKAAMKLEGYEILPGRKITIGTVSELLKQKEEKKDQGPFKTKGNSNVNLQPAGPIKRPGQQRGGRRGGLGKKSMPVASEESRTTSGKSNVDFKAMFTKGSS